VFYLSALDIHGGGRHTRGREFVEIRAKMNEAARLGWTVLEIAPEHIKSGKLRAWLLAAFNQDPDQRTKP
jgi:hypothetical protein